MNYNFLFTQHHRIAGVGRGSLELIPSNAVPRQGHGAGDTDTAQVCLDVSGEGDSTAWLGSVCKCPATLNVKFFLILRSNFLCCSLWPLLLVLWLGTTEKSGTIPSTAAFEIFTGINGDRLSVFSPPNYMIKAIKTYEILQKNNLTT